MTTETITNAIATRDNSPGGMVKRYSDDFRAVLPSHIKPDTWVRLAQGALKKGKKQGDRFELEIAAANNPGVFLAALLDAARLGLEPGTEQYYLTPRKVKGQLEILGIVGYQGLIELMYRAGAISSVVAECVYANDQFSFRPGRDDIPHHDIDWDADDRGQLRLVYAFARMQDGATSKVVVMNRAAIVKIKAKSMGADSSYSPWTTDEPAMWLKSAVRQLAKWVPTSSEFRKEQLRAVRDVANEPTAPAPFAPLAAAKPEDAVHPEDYVNITGGEVVDVEVLDGEVVDDAAVVEGFWNDGDKKWRIYVAGPMHGVPDFNLPSFELANYELTRLGFEVSDPTRELFDPSEPWEDATRAELIDVCGCDAVALLPGWQKSKAARLVAHAGRELGMQVHPLLEWVELASKGQQLAAKRGG